MRNCINRSIFASLKKETVNKIKDMIIVPVKEGQNIERSLKQFKRKFEKTGVMKEVRARKEYKKPSVVLRDKKIKAIYVQKLRQAEE